MSDFITHLLTESDAMLKHLASIGKVIPAHIPYRLYQLQNKHNNQSISLPLSDQSELSPDTRIELLDENELQSLTFIHQELAELVFPANPKTLALIQKEEENPSFFYFLGPVKLVRQLSLAAICFLVTIVIISASPEINLNSINQGLFESHGLSLIINQLFLLSCAGLGASFACLNRVSIYIKKENYNPKFDSSYWTSIIMGLIGGLIISELLPTNSFDPNSSLSQLDKPVIALLGGFSANVIYLILSRLVELIYQLFGGGSSLKPDIVAVKAHSMRPTRPHQEQQAYLHAPQKPNTDLKALAKKQEASTDVTAEKG